MRRLLLNMAVAAAAALVPTWAMAGNQEVAEQVAAALRDSGQLHGYRVGVKYQEGTAWLKGQVGTQEEALAAMQVASRVPGVTRVVNSLTIGSERVAAQATEAPVAIHTANGAASADQPAMRVARERVAINASESAPNQAQRLATTVVTPASEPQVEMTALEEPTLAPTKPAPEAAPAVKTPKPMPAASAQPPLPIARVGGPAAAPQSMPMPAGAAQARYDQPNLPNYSWPAYSAYPNYAAVTYPKQYSPTAWPYIGPFYPYPQVPLGWRKVTLEWHDGWWNLDFDDGSAHGPFSGLFRPCRRHY